MDFKLPKFMLNDDGEKKDNAPPVKPVTSSPASINSQSFNTTTATPITSNGVDYGKILDDACEAGHKEGADFWAFHKAITKMDTKPISEDQKYEISFAAFDAQGITAQKLVDSGNYYVGLLDNESKSFSNEMTGAQANEVTNKKSAVDAMTQENEAMNKKIQDNLIKMQQMNGEIMASTNNISNAKANFENQLNIKKSVFNDRITKIKQYLYASTTK